MVLAEHTGAQERLPLVPDHQLAPNMWTLCPRTYPHTAGCLCEEILAIWFQPDIAQADKVVGTVLSRDS